MISSRLSVIRRCRPSTIGRSGNVHQDVEPAPPLVSGREQRLQVFRVAHVAAADDATVAELRREAFARRAVDVEDRDPDTVRREVAGDGRAEAARAPVTTATAPASAARASHQPVIAGTPRRTRPGSRGSPVHRAGAWTRRAT